MIEMLSEETFKQKVFNYEKSNEWNFIGPKPVILNFTASWCGPCQRFAPVLEQVAQDHANDLQVFKVDIDQHPELPALFGIRSVPTTLFLKPGEDPAMAQGALGSEAMEQALQEILGITKA